MDKAKVPRRREPHLLPTVLSPEEVGRLLGATVNPKHRLLLSLAYAIGLRLAELCSLRLADLDFDRRLLWVRHGKGGKDRMVMLSPSLAVELRAYIEAFKPSIYHFENHVTGDHVSRRTAQAIFQSACANPGLPGKPVSMAYGTPSLPICWKAARIFAIFRPCWGIAIVR